MVSRTRGVVLALCFLWTPSGAAAEEADLNAMSLEDILNTKVSTAAKYSQQAREAPASVTVISSEEIDAFGFETLEDVFMHVRGFHTSNDRNYGYLGVRGFGRPGDYNNRVLLLLNGHTLNENVYGSAAVGTELGGFDLGTLERIEIVRGPGSVLYGTSAMFAVINLITKDPASTETVHVSALTGSFEHLQGTGRFAKRFENGVDALLSVKGADVTGPDLYFASFDDPSTNNGMATGLDWDRFYGIFGEMRFRELRVQGLVLNRDKGIPTAAWDTDFNSGHANTRDDHAFVEFQYDKKLTTSRSMFLRAYYDAYQYVGAYPYEGTPWLDSSDGRWFGGEARFLWDPHPSNRVIFGVEHQNHARADYHAWDEDNEYFYGDFPFNVSSVYVQNEYQMMRNMHVVLGLRHDEYSRAGGATSPRSALVYNPTDRSAIKMMYGRAFRTPNVYELYYEDLTIGHAANPNLASEEINTFEASWEQGLGAGFVSTVTAYDNEISGLIDLLEDPVDFSTQFQNVESVRGKGLEFGLTARGRRGLFYYMNYAVQRAENAITDIKLTNSPTHIIKTGLSGRLSRHFRASVEALYESSRNTVYDTKTDGYFLTNVRLSASVPLRREGRDRAEFGKATVSLRVKNLFDQQYAAPGGFEHVQTAIPQNGRTVFVKVATGF